MSDTLDLPAELRRLSADARANTMLECATLCLDAAVFYQAAGQREAYRAVRLLATQFQDIAQGNRTDAAIEEMKHKPLETAA